MIKQTITFNSLEDLTQALKHAEKAHGEYEKTLGHRDSNWPEWYAANMAENRDAS